MTKYLKRDIEGLLHDALKTMPVVVLTGMRQVGKSTLLQEAKGISDRAYLTLDDYATLQAARENPEALLESDKPITIDEVQRCPELLVAIKRQVDKDRQPGRFLLSGSANLLLLKGVSETLAGRAIYLTLYPFSQREIQKKISRQPFILRFIESAQVKSNVTHALWANDVYLGGMPPVCLIPEGAHNLWFKGYEQTYLERDVRELAQITDLLAYRNLLQLAALRTGQILKISELGRDAKLNSTTTSRYLGLAETSFVLHRLPPYLRNKASRLIKSPKLYFTDSGLACHLQGHEGVDSLPTDPLFGALLETYVAQNLRAILDSHSSSAGLFYWSIQGRCEVDFVIQMGQDAVVIEIKAASRWESRDLSGLRTFLKHSPECKVAILGYNGNQAIQIDKKIWAIPLGMLLS